MSIRKFIPPSIRLFIQKTRRNISDILSGQVFHFSSKKNALEDLDHSISLSQIIKKNSGVAAKLHNLKKASQLIESVQINPNQIFSFWKIVGSPTQKSGYQKGRTIINGQLTDSVGGGLCQLSGMIYMISLEANLEILERHNHSLDLYDETTRYTPLGSDATVVYGYKDLRIRNNLGFPIRFSFEVTNENISVSLVSLEKIIKKKVEYRWYVMNDEEVEVITFIDDVEQRRSKYRKGGIL